MGQDLTDRQTKILAFIIGHIEDRGFPPTLREIGRAFRISSTNGVREHLKALERKGHLRLSSKSRAIEVTDEVWERRGIPILGRVPAGVPLLSEEVREGYLDIEAFFGRTKGTFVLRVTGDSMKDAGIMDGDYVLVRKQSQVENGEIGVAFVDGEATVKRIYREKTGWRLQPENAAMAPLLIAPDREDFRIGGRVIGVLRRIS